MSDPLEGPGDRMFTTAAEYGRTHLGWTDDEPEVDHKADALNLLGAEWRNGAVAVAQVAEAQVHATLYLAEQQRVANMIAFGQATGESYRAEIRRGLGLS